jgi:molybdopterin-guanine dinucleotide biosynthesis protein A
VDSGTGPRADVGAIVLAGGRSSRFGSDKLAVEVDGSPLLRHAVDAVRAVAAHVVLVGPVPADLPGDVVVTREDPPYGGPYSAVVAGLDALDARATTVLVLAGDLVDPGPLLPRLIAALDRTDDKGRVAEAAVALDSDDRRQPLLAAYRVDALLGGISGVDPYHRAAYDLLDGLRVVTVGDTGRHSRDVDEPTDLP